MMPSPYPLEEELGMRYYASVTPGIGGRLRSSPEDFIVEELPLPISDPNGPYLICRLTKTNWELQRAVKEIAKRLGISHRRIAWAGTKDKNAVTTQFISIYDVTPEAVGQVHLKDITLEVVGRSQHSLILGCLAGNRFDITIRDCIPEDLAERVEAVTAVAARGVPNYYGLQRFGVVRPVTHLVGERILKGDYEGAVATYVGRAYPRESEAVRQARTRFAETRDPRAALADLPVQMTYERSMVNHLVANPGDYAGALRVLPPKLLSLLVSAFQSYLFNCALSSRIEAGLTLTEPEAGDRLLFSNGREDIVSARNRQAALLQIRRGRCRIALFISGAEPVTSHGPMDEIMQDLMQKSGVNAGDFERASRFVATKFAGVLRPISLSADVQAEISDTSVRLRFTLPPGHYATTVCREYMKADPYMMI
ncbi:MAG: tRNA pseudouridine(13) synthase TruD [Methanoculleus sp.]|uniref:tRNA pseudouridine(13) synthase TruD n=1 Tax=unclassified Methanoculleus TaxID=2619537 RepID=UPI0025D3D67C|nr:MULTISPECIES: tRNA pseudouridine(13) synthase TruD [unclassified Methanoculleus]MCK9317050.1 tRNA pseudouridine(13) synthase TruD [Methanoculleus sp.]MDD2254649.1 tRNA pseudouridine(13) synthase TruD [Methanoculleus sp.]MDD3214963.1 tRNA pseudouridine(13) synthase TruD [Methanoculleus sp.]MDD4315142.1 tRNA pseudouridine(13) synthase TruD [Methanoculleus sp.]MDD4471567.1 tRNA pseudouridine(13) synthase TruD [Methanoculleus sp.]